MAELVLYVEPEQHDIAVLYDVVFSLQSDQTFFFCRSMGSARDQIIIAYYLCADKSYLKVGMDLSCCLGCFRAFFDRPCAHLRLSCRKIADQAEQMVACFDQFLQT